jgi:hypothetical protein
VSDCSLRHAQTLFGFEIATCIDCTSVWANYFTVQNFKVVFVHVIEPVYCAETFSPKFTMRQFFLVLSFPEGECLFVNVHWLSI